MKIPFSPPYIDDQVVAEVTDSLRSGWITTGPKVAALQEEIVKLTGTQAALCVNSWTICGSDGHRYFFYFIN